MADTSNKLTISVCDKRQEKFASKSWIRCFILSTLEVFITDSVSCIVPLGIAMDHD